MALMMLLEVVRRGRKGYCCCIKMKGVGSGVDDVVGSGEEREEGLLLLHQDERSWQWR